ncbi:MAG: ribosome biogenesis GTPase Der [bacterium]|nr:ribosome biogenesis GTPase Der [bacterium]
MNEKIKKIESGLPSVVIFGRTNVGKSTLFNKIAGKSLALVSSIEGTTRDSNEKIIDWQGSRFELIDTGGIIKTELLRDKQKLKSPNIDENDINSTVQLKSREQLINADIILFVVDNKAGLLEQDKQMGLLIKKIAGEEKKIILVANKVDTPTAQLKTAEFYKLSFGKLLPVSAATGSGVGDLLDEICAAIPKSESENNERLEAKVAIIGQPNVGKSSLINAITGVDKIIVSSVAHTTREPQDTLINYKNNYIRLIDTAGIIKNKSKMNKQDFVSEGIKLSLAALKKSDIALLVLDIGLEISHHETKLISEVIENKISLIIVANKWDTISEKDHKHYQRQIYSKFPFVSWAPIIMLSAKNKTKINQLLDLVIEVNSARHKKIAPDELAEFLQSALRHAQPLSNAKIRGIMKTRMPKPKLKSLTQTYVNPPEFTLAIKSKLGLKGNYLKYLENRLREKFKFTGAPITIIIKN